MLNCYSLYPENNNGDNSNIENNNNRITIQVVTVHQPHTYCLRCIISFKPLKMKHRHK